ncbi:ARL14 effector protein isoform X2 [Danaus plexippus]|uniref:ARL14 effector protein isoform X2 n=1 Tax=Danaus plexippus TaxID=13037 RepID=UPI002AAF3221|nr:ARL14 effector protein isoform X2 [Danaus plexippus]
MPRRHTLTGRKEREPRRLLMNQARKENFDPATSDRERRKLNRKNYFMNRKNKKIYNERGLIASTGKDLCDCLDETCPGCHFPCPKCNSNKCGHECRCNRKWMYDKIEIEGNDFVIKNVYKKK